MYTKVLSLGLIASLIASASAGSIYRRSSLIDASGNTVVLDRTVSDSLNNLAIIGNANALTAAVLAEDGERSGSHHQPTEAESEINEDLADEFQKRSSLINASCNKVIAKDTVSNVANGATVKDNLNKLTAHVLARRSSVIDASGNVVSVKKTVHNVGNGIAVTDNVNNAVAKVINTRDTLGVKGTNVRLTNTVSDSLNGATATDLANNLHADVVKRGALEAVEVVVQEGAEFAVDDTLGGVEDGITKRDVIGVKGNNVLLKDTISGDLNGVSATNTANGLHADVL